MFPILGALILQAMYGAVDLLIVGRFGSAAGISAVSTGSGIMNLVTFVLCAISTSVTILIGRYLGERKPEKIGPLLGCSIAFFLALSFVFSIILMIFARPFAIFMQAPTEALELTVQYIRICSAGYVFIVFYNFLSAVFRGLGDSGLPLLFVTIACIVNIVGDLVLVALFHMDVAGAISRAFEYLKGFAPEAVVTSILFSFMGYFNGHSKSLFVMQQQRIPAVSVSERSSYRN